MKLGQIIYCDKLLYLFLPFGWILSLPELHKFYTPLRSHLSHNIHIHIYIYIFKETVIALCCVNLATLELHSFPKILFPVWLLVSVGPRRHFVQDLESWREVAAILSFEGLVLSNRLCGNFPHSYRWYRVVPSPAAPPALTRCPPSASPSAQLGDHAAPWIRVPAGHLGYQGWGGQRRT